MTLDLKNGETETPSGIPLFEVLPLATTRRSDIVGQATVRTPDPPRLAWPGCASFYCGGYGTLAQSRSSHQLTLLHGLPCCGSTEDFNSLCFEIENECPPLVVVQGLGSGGYATVVEAVHNVGAASRSFALKVVAKSKLRKVQDRERLKLELLVMTETSPSAFVSRCYMAFESVTNVFFVTDHLKGGDLFYHLINQIEKTGEGFTESQAQTLLAEIAIGIMHLHKHGFLHGDIKIENVLLDSSGHVTLIDLGLASRLDQSKNSLLESNCITAHESGSLIYMAPEMLFKGVGGRHTDWWALGVLAHELLTGRTPWSSLTDKEVICHEIRTLEIPLLPLPISKSASYFVHHLLQKDYLLRLGLKNDEFFNSLNWEAIERRETLPAFLPGPDCFNLRDRELALEDYANRSAQCSAAEPHPWFLGLDVVASHPVVEEENIGANLIDDDNDE
eukprot:CAMPEP_0114348636 /NCGR_PEP_ID=MMETSP0101-20121206/14861_1 /TAXON_ID=38822 ORGANISM="Pteridomonas danica, Strain PT" /NCGR_SAMPLE_ID=MMETSP0101 /ASSEMBLY_ACC=CAM_ASM_000211 /LENGTH=446 /DNA_ID=CAMNT_0001486669 /DNA_START=170 /DNA_END=1510 /DNA_ORIENTATION=-